MSIFSNMKQIWIYIKFYTKINNQKYSFDDFIVSDGSIYFNSNIENIKENILIHGQLNTNICTYLSDHTILEKIENHRGSFIMFQIISKYLRGKKYSTKIIYENVGLISYVL